MFSSRARTAGVGSYAAMPRDIAFRCWLAARPMIVACLMVACATATNTPAQDEAWRRWEACSGQTRGADLRSVQLDGRISFFAVGPVQGRDMVDCLARAGTSGPALPPAVYATFPGGP
jgi:hypothetical protein